MIHRPKKKSQENLENIWNGTIKTYNKNNKNNKHIEICKLQLRVLKRKVIALNTYIRKTKKISIINYLPFHLKL